MNLLVKPPIQREEIPPLPVYRFTPAQYDRMVEVGVLSAEDPVELLDGMIIVKGESTMVPAVYVSAPPGKNPWMFGPTPIPVSIRRFTLQQFHRMIESGILTEDDPIEFVEGWVLYKMPHKPIHDAVISKLHNKLINPILPPGWFCKGQSVIIVDTGEPEPDLSLVRGSEFDYLERHPNARDLGLAIEVSDTTLHTDRTVKWATYSRVAIPIYWIINIPDRIVEVYADPSGPVPESTYQERHDYGIEDQVPLVLDGCEIARIAVRDILP